MEKDTYTTKGRKVYQDPETGDNYSERSITFESKFGWINVPTVDEEGEEFSQEELEKFIDENGPIDPLTGEELETFDGEPEASAAAQERSDSLLPEEEEPMPLEMYHGGMSLMGCGDPMCEECGGGMMVGMDEESGNPIPPGSNEMNVRDDIPAVLSDGEYVVPADVVRWHGLKHMMEMRDEAKMGLMAMYAEGQIQMIEDEYEDYEDMPCEDCDGEDCDCEMEEYETPEGNEVEKAEPEIEEEKMDVEEDDEEDYSSDGKNTYRPKVKIALMKK
jgi:hypothetical protein